MLSETQQAAIAGPVIFAALTVLFWNFYKPLSAMFGGWAVLTVLVSVGVMQPEYACLYSGLLFCGVVLLGSFQAGFVLPGWEKNTREKYVIVCADWEHKKLYDYSHHEFTTDLKHNGRYVIQDETLNGREIGRAFELVHPHVWKYGEGADLEFYEARVDFRRKTLTVEYLDNAEKRRQLAAADRGQFSSEAFCIAFNPPPIVTKTFKLTDADLKGLK